MSINGTTNGTEVTSQVIDNDGEMANCRKVHQSYFESTSSDSGSEPNDSTTSDTELEAEGE